MTAERKSTRSRTGQRARRRRLRRNQSQVRAAALQARDLELLEDRILLASDFPFPTDLPLVLKST